MATLLVTLSIGIVVSLTLLTRANEEKFRKSIALDILRTQSARQLQESWNSTNAFCEIKSETLSAMAGMEVNNLTESEHRFTIALVAEGNPLARVLRAAPMLSQFESSMSDLVAKSTRFDLRLYKDPVRAIDDLARREVDFAQLNARQFVRARDRDPQIKALIRILPPADQTEAAVIFTRQSSGIKSLSELRGRSVLLGGAESTMSFWTKAALSQAGVHGIDLGKYRYVDRAQDISQENSISAPSLGSPYSAMTPVEAVMGGFYDAAVVREKRFKEVAAEQGLVALHRFTDSGDLLVARGDLSREMVGAFRRVILDQESAGTGPLLLSPSAGFRPATDEDFNGVLANLGAEYAFER